MAFPRFFAALAACVVLATPVWANDIQDINQAFRKGDLAGALAKANSYLAKNPKDAQARFLKGLIQADMAKTSEAIQTFTALTEDFPELPEPYNNLAVLYASQSKYDEAKNALEMAIRTHPSYATAHENLGDIYSKMASIAYDKALQIDSKNTAAQTKLSLIKEMLGAPARKVNVPKPAVAATPVRPATAVAAAGAAKPAAAQGDIELAITRWASAWSARDADSYINFYTRSYAAPGLSRDAWEAQRRERITAPKSIRVEISNLKISQAGERATATFRQSYRSDKLTSIDNKTLEFVREGGEWRIASEVSR